MIIWLASYPRSGNTLTRLFLYQVFDLPTLTIYPNENNVVATKKYPGTAIYDGTFEDLFFHARKADEGFVIKTHHPPLDDSPAIVIVRDGRSSVVSYYHYLRDVDRVDVATSSVIRGTVGIGEWSQTLDLWNPLTRPNTLLIRYEDAVNDPERVMGLISEFLGLEPVREWVDPFAKLQQVDPLHYRVGGNRKNLQELTPEEEELFWQMHRPWMERLGYCDDPPSFRSGMTSPIGNPPSRWFRIAGSRESVYPVPPAADSDRGLSDEELAFRKMFDLERQRAEPTMSEESKPGLFQKFKNRFNRLRRAG